jgi:hypothetical protein
MSRGKEKLLDEELDLLTTEVMNLKLNCRTEIDALKLEIETLKRLLAGSHPDFPERFQAVKEAVIREVSPE